MFGFFDGDFRRRPNVNIGGASKKLNKDELLAKAQSEREQRQVYMCALFDQRSERRFLIMEMTFRLSEIRMLVR
jgi:hypothetical protein